MYHESIDNAYRDTRAIILAHTEEIDQAMYRYGQAYTKELVRAILDDTHDKHIYISMKVTSSKGDKILAGNMDSWPITGHKPIKWKEVSIPREGNKPPLDMLLKTTAYPHNITILVGYDLYRVESVRNTLWNMLVQNVIISFFVSLLLSTGIIWLINQQLRSVNRTCNRIIQGTLSERVPVFPKGDQFNELGLNINRMLDWITVLLDTVKDSSNALAHDMRTPLSRHRLELNAVIEDPTLPHSAKKKIRHAISRLDTLSNMFDNLLTIAKAESRAGTELFEDVNMTTLTWDILDFYEALFEEKSQILSESLPEQDLIVFGDKQLLSQAIVNLIDNAIKYTPHGGAVSVRLEAVQHEHANAEVILTVADNGPGVPAELREKVKQRFYRIDKSRNTEGTGLGLNLVEAIATLHQGSLELNDNNPGLSALLRLEMKR